MRGGVLVLAGGEDLAGGHHHQPVDSERAAAYLLDAGFVTGSDLLIDGGVVAAVNAGRLNLGD